MATSLTSPLPSIHPILDPLIVSLADPGDPASGRDGQSSCEVQIEVEDVLNSGNWRLIGELLNPYNYDTDTAQAVIHKALQGALTYFLPNLTIPGAQAMPGPVKRYRLKARDVVDGIPDGSLVATDPGRAWLAGQAYVAHGTDLLSGRAYLFLTTRSLLRRLHPQEKIHLQVLPVSSGTPTVRIKALFTDGTDQTDTVGLGAAAALVPFAVNISIPAYSKTAHTIEIDITGLSGTAEKLTYRLISRPGPWFRQIFYANSLGGLDHLALTGKCEEIHTPTGEFFEAQEYPLANGQRGNSRAFNQRATDSILLRTGFMSQAEKISLRDLTLRNELWILEGNALRKLILTNAQWSPKSDDNYLHALELTARYSWDEMAYSR
jgi:hypothetical protein